MFATEAVSVITPSIERDDLGEPASCSDSVREVDVLVAPGPTADLDATRPSGVSVAYTLHFPKTWEGGSLKGCLVDVRGETFRVVGDPKPYTAANIPGRFNMPVEVVAVDG